MSSGHLVRRRDGSVEYLTLNRPAVRNAFNPAVIAELTAWAHEAARDPGLRAAVLAGAGPVFCAGADVAWMAEMAGYSRAQNLVDATALATMFDTLDRLPVPLIGRVHGAALGGGAGLVAVCDVAVAAEGAVFGFTEVRLGLAAASISPFVVAKIGQSAARELFVTGRRIDAARAREIGLVHVVVPEAELEGAVQEYVRDVLAGGPEAIAAAKALVPQVALRARDASISYTAEVIADRRVSAEGQEGLRAFLEKRPPAWAIPPDPARGS